MANTFKQPTQSDLDREEYLQNLASAQSKMYTQQNTSNTDYTTAPDRVSLYDLNKLNQSILSGAPQSDSPVLDFWKRQQAAKSAAGTDYTYAPDRISLNELRQHDKSAAQSASKSDIPKPGAWKAGQFGPDTDYTYAPDRVSFALANFLTGSTAAKTKTPDQPAAERSAPWQNTPQYGDDGTPLTGTLAQTGKPGYDKSARKIGGLIDEAALEAAIAEAFPEYSPDDDDEDDWLEKPLQPDDDEDDWLESAAPAEPAAQQAETGKILGQAILGAAGQIKNLGSAGSEAARDLANSAAAGAELIGSGVMNGLTATAGALENAAETTGGALAQGVTQTLDVWGKLASEVSAPINQAAKQVSENRLFSTYADYLREISRDLEYIGTGGAGNLEGISDAQIANLMEKLRKVRILGFPLPEGLSKRLAETEDALLDFSITKAWEESIEDRYKPDEKQKQRGKILQKIAAGPLPYIMDFLGIEGHPLNEDREVADTGNTEQNSSGKTGTDTGGAGDAWGSNDDLIKSATTPGKGGVSPVGRAFQKHAGNPGRAGTFVGDVSGNAAKNTEQGVEYLNDILGNPQSSFTIRDTKTFGKVLDVRLPDGTGARWSADGKTFIMFLEKYTPLK